MFSIDNIRRRSKKQLLLLAIVAFAASFGMRAVSAQAFTWTDVIHRSTLGTKGCAEISKNQLGKHCMSRRWPIHYVRGAANPIPAARLRLNATGHGAHVGIRITCTAETGKLYEYDLYPLSSSRSIPLGRSWMPLLPHKFVNLKGQTVIPQTCTVVVYMTDPDSGWVGATIQRSTSPGQH